MDQEPLYQSRFDALKCCVIIPTYNNYATISRVLTDVLRYTRNIIVVNDGSTDATAAILNAFQDLTVIHIPSNKGKGNALKTGFKASEDLDYEYAISMDSDGQHFPDDLHVFLDTLEEHLPQQPNLLIIGARKMNDPSVPNKSSIGNQFSTLTYWLETGIKLTDTQCGYRLYPLKIVNQLNLFTSRFELEIEVIVKAAWEGVKVINMPVKVLYDPEERVTHFKPWQDVARITLLNIYFVVIGAFYIAPRNLLRKLRSKKEPVQKTSFSEKEVPLE